jgi:hypothetical protein
MQAIVVKLHATDRRLVFLRMRARRTEWSITQEIHCIVTECQTREEIAITTAKQRRRPR